jgi:hypothetical protein
MKNRRLFPVLVLSLLLACAPAFADSITYSASFGPTTTSFSTPIMLPQFNPSMGTLTSITFTLDGQTAGSAQVTNNSGATGSYQVTISSNLKLLDPSNNTLISVTPSFNQTLSIANGDSATATGTSPVDTGSTTITSGFGPYVGLGDVSFTVLGEGIGGVLGPSPFTVDSITKGEGTITVTYNTSSVVPEPATLALFGSGLLALGLLYQRRREHS